MINKILLISVLFFSQLALAESAAPPNRNRMEELFLWKVSEDLKLSVSEDKALSDFVKDLNKRRNSANEAVQTTLKKIAEASDAKSSEKALADYKKKIKSYNDLSIEEIDRMKKILGPQRASKYFTIKNDLSNRIKTLLAAPDKPDDKVDLSAPKVIVE